MKIVHRTHARIKHLNEKVKRRIIAKLSSSLPETKTRSEHRTIKPTIMEVVPSKQNTKLVGANWLIGYKGNEYSEHGEDGIISKIFDIMKPENKWVCEFGAHDPEVISNTWRLINQEGWQAVLIEADPVYADKLKNYYAKHSNAVYCVNTKVHYEGNQKLDHILSATPIPRNMDFMIIDIDGNDYHVWEAIDTYRAKVVMIEFNASIPTDVAFAQPRDMSINQGSSLKAMVDLGASRGYKLIAVTSWNAFFIQDEYYHLFFNEEPLLEDMYVYPAKHPIWMRPFQLYDGTIAVAPWNEMLWHNINLSESDYQVLPVSMRVFSRELMAKNFVLEKTGDKTSLDHEIAEHLNQIYKMPGNVLSKFVKNYFSRYGEDGIVEALLPHLGVTSKYFIEVGAGDGLTFSLSRNLLANHHWKGLQLENDLSMLDRLKINTAGHRAKIISEPYSLSGEHTLESIFEQNDVPLEPDVMILKVYGMEYFLWESVTRYSPKMVVVQFNPTISNDVKFIQEKDFSVHHGCSLKAFCDLAHYKDYELVAVTLETAIFVKRKYTYRLLEVYGLQHSDIDEMFIPITMKWFQLYDGTIVSHGLSRLMWHGLRIDEEKLQVVPKSLRTFHQFADPENKKHFYRV
jgi:hypothetical protein